MAKHNGKTKRVDAQAIHGVGGEEYAQYPLIVSWLAAILECHDRPREARHMQVGESARGSRMVRALDRYSRDDGTWDGQLRAYLARPQWTLPWRACTRGVALHPHRRMHALGYVGQFPFRLQGCALVYGDKPDPPSRPSRHATEDCAKPVRSHAWVDAGLTVNGYQRARPG